MRAKLDAREWAWSGGPYAGLHFAFRVRCDDEAAGGYLASVLDPLASPVDAPHTYSIVDHGPQRTQRAVVYLDGRRITRASSVAAAVPHLLWHVNRSTIRESGQYLLVHASAAEAGGRALVFPGAMEAGKTTLVAGLLRRGFRYVTDEVVALDLAAHVVVPYPKSLSVDPGSWDVLADLAPRLPGDLAAFSITQWQVDPRAVRHDAIAAPCPVALVIAPRYAAGEPTRAEPVSRAVGVRLLAENSFNFADHGAAGLAVLAAVVRGADCYRLTIGSLDEACDIISGLAGYVGTMSPSL